MTRRLLLIALVLTACTGEKPQDEACVPEGSGCVRSCEEGNAIKVGKYCTKGGGECSQGWKSGFAYACTADNTDGESVTDGNAFCTMACDVNAECGTGAICTGSTPDSKLKGCFPARCDPSNPGTVEAPDAGTADAGT